MAENKAIAEKFVDNFTRFLKTVTNENMEFIREGKFKNKFQNLIPFILIYIDLNAFP